MTDDNAQVNGSNKLQKIEQAHQVEEECENLWRVPIRAMDDTHKTRRKSCVTFS